MAGRSTSRRRSGRRGDDGDGPDRRRLKAGFVLLVGLSGGTVALQGDASLPVIGLAILGGAVAGGVLLWYLMRVAE